jgi:hypothetical protein
LQWKKGSFRKIKTFQFHIYFLRPHSEPGAVLGAEDSGLRKASVLLSLVTFIGMPKEISRK